MNETHIFCIDVIHFTSIAFIQNKDLQKDIISLIIDYCLREKLRNGGFNNKSASACLATYKLRPQDVGASTLPQDVAILVDDPLYLTR